MPMKFTPASPTPISSWRNAFFSSSCSLAKERRTRRRVAKEHLISLGGRGQAERLIAFLASKRLVWPDWTGWQKYPAKRMRELRKAAASA